MDESIENYILWLTLYFYQNHWSVVRDFWVVKRPGHVLHFARVQTEIREVRPLVQDHTASCSNYKPGLGQDVFHDRKQPKGSQWFVLPGVCKMLLWVEAKAFYRLLSVFHSMSLKLFPSSIKSNQKWIKEKGRRQKRRGKKPSLKGPSEEYVFLLEQISFTPNTLAWNINC